MTTDTQPEALRLAELLTADEWPGHMTLVSYARECVAELRRQHAELETLRMGYAAARLEIESLKVQSAAQQPDAVYAALPDECDSPEICAISKTCAGQYGTKRICASHGQAPAGAYKDSTPDLHVGDSSFESWYADYVKEGTKGLKQHCRDAYAAGMGDPLVRASPAAVAGSSDDLVTRESAMQAIEHLAISNSPGREYDAIAMLAAAPTTQPAPQQEASPTAGMNIAQRILHVGGRNNAAGYVEFGSIQAVEALVRQVLRDLPSAPQPSPAAQGDALDAARWRMLPAFFEEYQIDAMKLYRDIDAARAAQEGKSHEHQKY